MGQGDSARDFDTSESMKNAGILDVFPIFHTARLGQKIRRSPQLPLCGVALGKNAKIGLLKMFGKHSKNPGTITVSGLNNGASDLTRTGDLLITRHETKFYRLYFVL